MVFRSIFVPKLQPSTVVVNGEIIHSSQIDSINDIILNSYLDNFLRTWQMLAVSSMW